MKNLLMILGLIGLVGCAGGSGGGSSSAGDSAPGSSSPVVTSKTYTFRVIGNGLSFQGQMTQNMGDSDTLTTPISLQTISGGPYDYAIYGRTAFADFAFRGGSGTLTVELYENGTLVDSRSTSTVGNSLSFAHGF